MIEFTILSQLIIFYPLYLSNSISLSDKGFQVQ